MCNMVNSYCSWDIEGRNIRKTAENYRKKPWNSVFSKIDILLMVAQNPLTHSIFWIKFFQMHLNILPKLILCCHLEQIKKWAIFDILLAVALEVNMITRQMTPFLLSTFWALCVGIFHFCISRPSKFTSMGFHPWIMFLFVKYTFTCQIWHFQVC